MANRGLYGCAEGNEQRGSNNVVADWYRANEICEGDIVAKWRAMYKKGWLTQLGVAYEETLADWIDKGVARTQAIARCQSMLSTAMCNARSR